MKVCPECEKEIVEVAEVCETLVGFSSPPGHDHDNNCLSIDLRCEAGHRIHLSPRRKCFVEGCDWVGKEECFCHKGKKDPEWPEVLEQYMAQTRNLNKRRIQ